MTAHTTTFIVNGADYFVANLDNGGVRIGLTGEMAFDFPASHANYANILGCANEADAEGAFDSCFASYGSAVVII